MIVIRNVFRLKFGQAREAVAVAKEGLAIQKRVMTGVEHSSRLLTDVTGPFYTLVLELTVPNLSNFETYARVSSATRSGRQTIRRWFRSSIRASARCSRSSSKGGTSIAGRVGLRENRRRRGGLRLE